MCNVTMATNLHIDIVYLYDIWTFLTHIALRLIAKYFLKVFWFEMLKLSYYTLLVEIPRRALSISRDGCVFGVWVSASSYDLVSLMRQTTQIRANRANSVSCNCKRLQLLTMIRGSTYLDYKFEHLPGTTKSDT